MTARSSGILSNEPKFAMVVAVKGTANARAGICVLKQDLTVRKFPPPIHRGPERPILIPPSACMISITA